MLCYLPPEIPLDPKTTVAEKRVILSPNPVNEILSVQFQLENPAVVVLDLCNLHGENMATVSRKMPTPGLQEISVNVDGFSAGIYLFILRAGRSNVSGRFIKN
jgi:hypothetical protein